MSDEDDLQLDADEARIEAILQQMSSGDLDLETPPESVWAGIEAKLAHTPVAQPSVAQPGVAQPGIAQPDIAPVIDLAAHRRRRTTIAIGAVAAAAALLVGLSIALTGDNAGPPEVASATMRYQPELDFDALGAEAAADATLLDDDGRELIRLDDVALPAPTAGENLELWLIGFDSAGEIEIIQTLGVVDDLEDPGSFVVPAGFDRDSYEHVEVDISVEPRDGVETHSGRSILRGPLTT
jgi:hypothetical protein